MRAELLERYQALPLPTTSDEHWRFTDLEGFDPDAWGVAPGDDAVAAPPMLDLDVSGVAHIGETGVTIERAPEGIRFEALTDDHPLLGTLVGAEDKFSAHNAALWQHGLLVHVPAGVEVERPLYVRVANATEGGSLFWRLLVVAEAGSRFTLIEELSSAAPGLDAYANAAVEIVVQDGAKVEYVNLQNLSRATWLFAAVSRTRRA